MKYVTLKNAPSEDLKLLPQSTVKCAFIDENDKRNAVWDMIVTKNGRCFFSVCAELFVCESAGLYEYKYDTNETVCCFELDKTVCTFKDAIMPSKIHTSLAEMNDGRLIMTTHTTSQSRVHPYWYAEPFYNHVYEGYQGSHIIIYNPETGMLENRGIPVPHESIYGGAYDPIHNCYYFTGYFKGNLYRYDIDGGSVTDYGKVTEFGTFRLFRSAIDGNIYSASRSGYFYRINCKTQKIEELGIFFDKDYEPYSTEKHVQLDYITDGKDGKIYFRYIFGYNIYRYDPATNKVECLGDGRPEGMEFSHPNQQYGLACDDNGVLWYTLSNRSEQYDWTDAHLVRWDVLKGEKPRNMGLVGTAERGVNIAAELHVHGDILYITSGNHFFDIPGMFAVDLKKLQQKKYDLKDDNPDTPMSFDVLNYLHIDNAESIYPYGKEEFERQMEKAEQFRKYGEEYGEFIRQNPMDLSAKSVKTYPIWKSVGREKSPVKYVCFDNGRLCAQFGNVSEKFFFDAESGKMQKIEEFTVKQQAVIVPEEKIPCACGRRFKAKQTAGVKISDDKYLVGTFDGLLFLWDGKQSYNLGSCPNCSGQVKDICYCEKTKTAYGIIGSENDIAIVFSYDENKGVEYLGRIQFNTENGLFLNCVFSSIAVNDDGTRIALGADEKMGVVYDITL